MRPFSGHAAQDSQCGGDSIAPPLMSQSDNRFGIKVVGIGSKRGARRVLDALVDRQDGEVTTTRQPAMVEERLETAQNANLPVAAEMHFFEPIGSRQVERFLWNVCTGVTKQLLGLFAQLFLNVAII